MFEGHPTEGTSAKAEFGFEQKLWQASNLRFRMS